jgi:hypothetical protein
MSTPCKACELLAPLDPENAQRFNTAILERQISAITAAHLLSKNLGSVGASTLKKHRKEQHSV